MLSSRVPSSPSVSPRSVVGPRRMPGNLDGLDSGVGGSLSDRPAIRFIEKMVLLNQHTSGTISLVCTLQKNK